jgi:hypothetical protein
VEAQGLNHPFDPIDMINPTNLINSINPINSSSPRHGANDEERH